MPGEQQCPDLLLGVQVPGSPSCHMDSGTVAVQDVHPENRNVWWLLHSSAGTASLSGRIDVQCGLARNHEIVFYQTQHIWEQRILELDWELVVAA